MTEHLKPTLASDIHPGLTALYAHARANDLPRAVTREEYDAARDLPDDSYLKAFIGFGCSFGGKWFGGFIAHPAPGKGDSPASAARAIERASRACGSEFACIDFLRAPVRTDMVLYLDPPYRGTTGYGSPFDFEAFDNKVAEYARHVPVFVSEYEYPAGTVIWEKSKHVGMRSGVNAQAAPHRVERLFLL